MCVCVCVCVCVCFPGQPGQPDMLYIYVACHTRNHNCQI